MNLLFLPFLAILRMFIIYTYIYIQIQQIPHSLFKDDGYDHREALFGIPPYGGSIAQNVYYADDDLCDPNVDTTKGYPRREKDEKGKMASWEAPYILMVDRGGCTFVKKVSNIFFKVRKLKKRQDNDSGETHSRIVFLVCRCHMYLINTFVLFD